LQQPFLLMIAGPNGAGKTTLTRLLRERGLEFGEYINPDDIAREIGDPSYMLVQKIADQRRDARIEARRSFSFETVMSHPSKIDVLVRAKAAGFFVQVYFVGTDDPQTNVERVALRVAQGGHDVPKDRIVARWKRTMELLQHAMAAADQTLVFDNSASGSVAAGPRLVFRWSYEYEHDSRGEFLSKRLVSQAFPPIPDWVRRYACNPVTPSKHGPQAV